MTMKEIDGLFFMLILVVVVFVLWEIYRIIRLIYSIVRIKQYKEYNVVCIGREPEIIGDDFELCPTFKMKYYFCGEEIRGMLDPCFKMSRKNMKQIIESEEEIEVLIHPKQNDMFYIPKKSERALIKTSLWGVVKIIVFACAAFMFMMLLVGAAFGLMFDGFMNFLEGVGKMG